MSDKHKLQELLDTLKERDDARVERLNRLGAGRTIEAELYLASARVDDCMHCIWVLGNYIILKELEAQGAPLDPAQVQT